MTIGITPTIATTPAIFYDKNSNPLNIPCEGPKVVKVTCDFSVDINYLIDLGSLYTSGKFTYFQSMGAFVTGVTSPITLTISGIPQVIVGSFTTMETFPVISGSFPQIGVKGNTGGQIATLYFYNFMMPSFVL